MNVETNDRIIELFAAKADLAVAELELEQSLEDIGLDSLHLMEIALWVRKEYGVDIPEGDLRHDQTLREALAYLDQRTR